MFMMTDSRNAAIPAQSRDRRPAVSVPVPGTGATCPAWCTTDHGKQDEDGNVHHMSTGRNLPTETPGAGHDVEVYASVFIHADQTRESGVCVTVDAADCLNGLSPTRARQIADALYEAAEQVENLEPIDPRYVALVKAHIIATDAGKGLTDSWDDWSEQTRDQVTRIFLPLVLRSMTDEQVNEFFRGQQ